MCMNTLLKICNYISIFTRSHPEQEFSMTRKKRKHNYLKSNSFRNMHQYLSYFYTKETPELQYTLHHGTSFCNLMF